MSEVLNEWHAKILAEAYHKTIVKYVILFSSASVTPDAKLKTPNPKQSGEE
jgi:hypothetical protein